MRASTVRCRFLDRCGHSLAHVLTSLHLDLDADLLDAEEEEGDEELGGDGRLASRAHVVHVIIVTDESTQRSSAW